MRTSVYMHIFIGCTDQGVFCFSCSKLPYNVLCLLRRGGILKDS